MLNQGAAVEEIVVYDDHSTDATAEIIHRYAAIDRRVKRIESKPLPAGWCGKNFACHRLAVAAQTEWLLFLDADVRLSANAVASLIAEAEGRHVTLLSAWPGIELAGFWEKALMPMLNFVVFTLFPTPLSIYRNDPSLGLAHGACLLANRAAYERVGGHAQVRDEIFEDTRLAQLWRLNGERSLCLDGQELVRVRMYSSFAGIWKGFQKNFHPAFRHEWTFWSFLALHAAFFLQPFLLGNWNAAAIVLCSRGVLALRFKQPWWTVLTHPFGEIFLLALGVSSWWVCRIGGGVHWKGREYRTSRV
ncbi:MAG: glycosyltransferase family 2 protein [Acidobacteriota bacterium]|nr:glycosyltransferase family 2 protein [Acidobacteriota bacterium]